MSTENEYEKHDDEVMGMAYAAIKEAGLAFPGMPQVRNDLLRLMDCLRLDYRAGNMDEGAIQYGSSWVEVRPHYLNALRWADLCAWRFNGGAEGVCTDTRAPLGYADTSQIMDMMHDTMHIIYADLAHYGLAFIIKQEEKE
jgi:hypothetical protein